MDNCTKCYKLRTLHSCNLCLTCCYCSKFIFIINGYKLVGDAYQIDNVALLNITVILQYLDISDRILIKSDVNTFSISTNKIDSVGWRTE